jgi:uncharacterized membrane protein YdjX (TVP38/TMEM64 family)
MTARRAWVGLLSLCVVAFVAFAALAWVRSVGGPDGVRERYGAAAPAITFVAHTASDTTPAGDLLPLPFGVANGALYGFLPGALLSWLAWMASASINWAIARRTARDLSLADRLSRLPRWMRRLPIRHPLFLITARWVPTGGALATFAAGAAGVGLARLLCCTAIGAWPPAVVLAAIGAGLLEPLLFRFTSVS